MVAQLAGEIDQGIAAAVVVRVGIVTKAWAGGRSRGRYVVVERVLGYKTAWAIEVRPEHSDRIIAARLEAMRELFAAENERWDRMTDVQPLVVVDGRRPAEQRRIG